MLTFVSNNLIGAILGDAPNAETTPSSATRRKVNDMRMAIRANAQQLPPAISVQGEGRDQLAAPPRAETTLHVAKFSFRDPCLFVHFFWLCSLAHGPRHQSHRTIYQNGRQKGTGKNHSQREPARAQNDGGDNTSNDQAAKGAIMNEPRNPAATAHPIDHAPHPGGEEQHAEQNLRDVPKCDHLAGRPRATARAGKRGWPTTQRLPPRRSRRVRYSA